MEFRIQVKKGKTWRWGMNTYTYEDAIARKAELESIGIKCRVNNFTLKVLA